MSLEKVLSWVAVLGGGLSPILVAFVVLIIGRSRSGKRDYGTLASGSVIDQARRHHGIEVSPQCHRSQLDPQSHTNSPGGRGESLSGKPVAHPPSRGALVSEVPSHDRKWSSASS